LFYKNNISYIWINYLNIFKYENNLYYFGVILYNYYYIFVIICSYILLLAMLGSILMVLDNNINNKCYISSKISCLVKNYQIINNFQKKI
jgi:hypothetical protein